MISRRLRLLLAGLIVVSAATYVACIATPAGPRDTRAFDPDATAEREVDMWKAYYDKQNLTLFTDLVVQMRETYRCTWWTASRIAFSFARAASTFGNLQGDYERVLPDLEAAYGRIRDWTGATYDSRAVARAELAWWVARRIAGRDSPEQVGGLIADLNALLYAVPRARVLDASVMRARAGKLRDEGGPEADWNQVSRLLHASYHSLHDAVAD